VCVCVCVCCTEEHGKASLDTFTDACCLLQTLHYGVWAEWTFAGIQLGLEERPVFSISMDSFQEFFSLGPLARVYNPLAELKENSTLWRSPTVRQHQRFERSGSSSVMRHLFLRSANLAHAGLDMQHNKHKACFDVAFAFYECRLNVQMFETVSISKPRLFFWRSYKSSLK